MLQNPMQLMNLIANNNSPMQLIQQMFGNNAIMGRAIQMGQGKSPEQIQQIIKNIAHEKGMTDEQLNQFISNFGLKI